MKRTGQGLSALGIDMATHINIEPRANPSNKFSKIREGAGGYRSCLHNSPHIGQECPFQRERARH